MKPRTPRTQVTYDQQPYVVLEVVRIVPLVDDHAADVDDFGVRRSYGSLQASSDHPEVAGRPLPVVAVHQTVRRRQDGAVVDEASAAKVATAERGLVGRFPADRDLKRLRD